MTIRAEVLALASLGPLPSESEGDVHDLAVRQSALQAIEPPVTVEEARALLPCFGPDDCFGLAWTLLHLVESCPAPGCVVAPPLASANEWVRRLWGRHVRATKFGECERNAPATEAAICATEASLKIVLPPDYRSFLLESNGVEGFLSELAYVMFYKVEELPEAHAGCCVDEFAPGLVIIGSAGDDLGYGFVQTPTAVRWVSFSFVTMSLDELRDLGATFDELLEAIRAGRSIMDDST